MNRVLTDEVSECIGAELQLAGWIHHVRPLSQVTFVILRDRSGVAQVVVEDMELREWLAGLHAESVVEVIGIAKAEDRAPRGVEVHASSIRLVSASTADPPIELRRRVLKEQLPRLLDHAAVAVRHPSKRAIFAISAAAVAGFRRTLDALDFTEINTPKILGTATESGANVFTLDYFGRPAYLAQSPQFYKQMMVGAFERVYETGPVFRAEPHDTARHLAEYVSLDAELGFIRDYGDVMTVVRHAVAGMVDEIRREAAAAVELLGVEMPEVPDVVPAIDFGVGQQMIEDATGESVVGEPDLAPAHERWLGEWAQRESGCDFVFVTGYPLSKRPFYTHPDPDRPDRSNSFDLLFRGLELATGGQRLHRLEDYLVALQSRSLDADAFESYLEAFRYGMPPHGGFAIGLERFVARLIEASNVREATLFPRDIQRLAP
ncbi:MAG TPA: aspartate--tRNA(Asn) ligase [Acidimicrobiales bacterium]|jgi:nondiscriminating aspartyl-tRNA synthetase|nr:aspartate--tRNA(Asn) ligase [Acidimicrobiales bacterium]